MAESYFVFLSGVLQALWQVSEVLTTSKDNKASAERLFKVQDTAWQGSQKEVCDDPTKEGNLK